MKLPVLIAADGALWEAAILAAFDEAGSGVTVARRCIDVVDLLAVAASGQGRAALVAASLRHLDADAVDRLIASDVVPVAVVPRGDAEVENRMRALGVAHLVPEDADSAVVASVVVEAVAGAHRSESPSRAARTFSDPATSMAVPPGVHAEPAEQPARDGVTVAVWGPTGAPGRTTVAVTLADEIARLDAACLLVDADVYGGTVAAALGLLDESPGLAAACRQAAATRLTGAALAALCWQVRPQLRVLTGLPLASRWPELRPAAVSAVLGCARGIADVTVVDCGFCLESDEELSFDSLAPRRNGATLAVLDAADVVVVVGAADPVGMQRLVRALADLQDAEIGAPQWIVVNKVRRGVVPGDARTEVAEALQLLAGRTPAALLPYDRDALDAALAAGRTLAEIRPASPLRRGVSELAAALAGRPVHSRRRHRR